MYNRQHLLHVQKDFISEYHKHFSLFLPISSFLSILCRSWENTHVVQTFACLAWIATRDYILPMSLKYFAEGSNTRGHFMPVSSTAFFATAISFSLVCTLLWYCTPFFDQQRCVTIPETFHSRRIQIAYSAHSNLFPVTKRRILKKVCG